MTAGGVGAAIHATYKKNTDEHQEISFSRRGGDPLARTESINAESSFLFLKENRRPSKYVSLPCAFRSHTAFHPEFQWISTLSSFLLCLPSSPIHIDVYTALHSATKDSGLLEKKRRRERRQHRYNFLFFPTMIVIDSLHRALLLPTPRRPSLRRPRSRVLPLPHRPFNNLMRKSSQGNPESQGRKKERRNQLTIFLHFKMEGGKHREIIGSYVCMYGIHSNRLSNEHRRASLL